VNPRDPNIQMVETVAQALDELCEELVFVGGCAAGLLCTSPSAAPPRVTYDVDVVAEVVALAAYHALEERFAARGFVRDMSQDAPSAVGAWARWKSI
jgi:putative NIF3 family GTP cyclohydrolase 1 type 2